jgi:acetyltransferase-like isoleucine patch superfamily enzyme
MNSQNSWNLGKAEIVNVQCGEGVKIIEPCNLYDCIIGEYSFVGPFVEIQSKVLIGKKCRIQSHSFICSMVTIADNCFIGHGVIFTNDLFRNGMPSTDEKDWLPTKIGDNVSIGSGSTILPVRIAPGTVIGAGSVVTHDLTVTGIYAGNPAKFIRKL